MMTLPKVLYIFQSLPVCIPGAYFRALRSLIQKFVWKGKGSRISYKAMSRSRENGGVLLPDPQKYYEAAVIKRVIDWVHNTSHKKWVSLEENMSKMELGQIIWIPKKIFLRHLPQSQ